MHTKSISVPFQLERFSSACLEVAHRIMVVVNYIYYDALCFRLKPCTDTDQYHRKQQFGSICLFADTVTMVSHLEYILIHVVIINYACRRCSIHFRRNAFSERDTVSASLPIFLP